MTKEKTCKICSSRTKEIFSAKYSIIYNYCDNCEFISKDKKYIVTREEELRIYNQHNNSIKDPRYVSYFNKFINAAIIPNINKGNCLDFGSGPEPVLAMILERDYNFKVDIYDYFYQPIKTYVGNKYDLITSTEVVEHFVNPMEYFKLFKQHLLNNGYLSIMTLFHPNNEEEFLNWHYIRDMTHISFYTPKTMKYISHTLGLDIVYCDNHRYITFIKI